MPARWLETKTEIAYALLRIVSGLMFSFHGVQKLFGVLAPTRQHFPAQLWFGGVIELVGGIAIALGIFTRCAAFVASGTMAVAYVQFHWQLKMGSQLLPAINRGELAALYCFVFLLFAFRGGGPWSVDQWRRRPARR